MGLGVAARIARSRSLVGDDLVADIDATLKALDLPTSIPGNLDAKRLLARTRHDKKRKGHVRRMVLPHARGGAGLYDVDDAELLAALSG
jgi:3-dehydroquinate synthetase